MLCWRMADGLPLRPAPLTPPRCLFCFLSSPPSFSLPSFFFVISNLQRRGTRKPQAGNRPVRGEPGRERDSESREIESGARGGEGGGYLLSAALMGYLLKAFLPLRIIDGARLRRGGRMRGKEEEWRGKEGEGEGEQWRVRREGGGEGWTSDVIWGDPYNGAYGLRKTVGNRGRDKRV